jgi:hypothetical protein
LEALAAELIPPTKGVGTVIFFMVRMTLSQLVLKLFWDNEKPASSNFIIWKRKQSAEVLSSKQGRWRIV